MGVGLVHIVLEVVLSIASGYDFFNSRSLLNLLDGGGFFSGDRSPLLLTIVFFLKVAFLTIVVASDTCFIPRASGFFRSLGSANIYRARVRSVRGTLVLALLLIVRLVVSSRVLGAIALLLLLPGVLAVVNANGLRDKFVEYTRPVFLIEFILNIFL